MPAPSYEPLQLTFGVLDVDTRRLRSWAEMLQHKATRATGALVSLETLRQSSTHWQADAATAYRDQLTRYISDLEESVRRLTTCCRETLAFAAGLDSLQRQAIVLSERARGITSQSKQPHDPISSLANEARLREYQRDFDQLSRASDALKETWAQQLRVNCMDGWQLGADQALESWFNQRTADAVGYWNSLSSADKFNVAFTTFQWITNPAGALIWRYRDDIGRGIGATWNWIKEPENLKTTASVVSTVATVAALCTAAPAVLLIGTGAAIVVAGVSIYQYAKRQDDVTATDVAFDVAGAIPGVGVLATSTRLTRLGVKGTGALLKTGQVTSAQLPASWRAISGGSRITRVASFKSAVTSLSRGETMADSARSGAQLLRSNRGFTYRRRAAEDMFQTGQQLDRTARAHRLFTVADPVVAGATAGKDVFEVGQDLRNKEPVSGQDITGATASTTDAAVKLKPTVAKLLRR